MKKTTKMLSKAAICKEGKLKTEVVPLKKGAVIVSEIGADAYMEVMGYSSDTATADNKDKVEVDMKKFNPCLVSYCIGDENGDRIFDDDDIPMIAATRKRMNFHFCFL